MANWPGTLPQSFLQGSYQETELDLALSFKPDFGPPLTRKRGETNIRPFSGDMHLTATQKGTLKTFWLDNCAIPFNFPDPDSGIPVSVMFLAPPQYADTGLWKDGERVWKAKMQLAQMP